MTPKERIIKKMERIQKLELECETIAEKAGIDIDSVGAADISCTAAQVIELCKE